MKYALVVGSYQVDTGSPEGATIVQEEPTVLAVGSTPEALASAKLGFDNATNALIGTSVMAANKALLGIIVRVEDLALAGDVLEQSGDIYHKQP